MPEKIESDKVSSGCGSCCFFKKAKKSRKNREQYYKSMVGQCVGACSNGPFVQDLPKDLSSGTSIHIAANVKPECSRFSVNLVCDKRTNGDIAFHFNPRLFQRYVVRNCRLNGQWGDEETTSIVKFQLSRNKKFDLNIFIADKEFLVALNGKHICAFGFRVPLSKVTAIEVHGLVEVYSIEYRKLQIYPSPTPQNVPFTVPLGSGPNSEIPIQQLDIPLTGLLPRGFQQDWQLEIYGRVKILPHGFYVNLQEDSHLWPHPIIPLHLNPRFSTTFGKRLFVRNAWIDGGWGQEERAPGFQFSPGSPFNMAIRRGDDHFSVWVDGQLVGEFKFRGSVDKINAVYIQGDVLVENVYMIEHVNDLYFNKK